MSKKKKDLDRSIQTEFIFSVMGKELGRAKSLLFAHPHKFTAGVVWEIMNYELTRTRTKLINNCDGDIMAGLL